MSFDYEPPGSISTALSDADPELSELASELRGLGFTIVNWEPPTTADVRRRIEDSAFSDSSGVPHVALRDALLADDEVLAYVHADMCSGRRFI